MWWPQTKNADYRDRDAGPDDEFVAEQLLASEYRNDLRHDAEARQDHDVDRGMRVEPEQVLEQQRVAAQSGIEHADMEQRLEHQQQQRDRQHRCGQHEDDAGGIQRPDEDRQPVPGQAGGTQAVDGDDEVQPGGNGGEAGDEDADRPPRRHGPVHSCWTAACRMSSRCRRRRRTRHTARRCRRP